MQSMNSECNQHLDAKYRISMVLVQFRLVEVPRSILVARPMCRMFVLGVSWRGRGDGLWTGGVHETCYSAWDFVGDVVGAAEGWEWERICK